MYNEYGTKQNFLKLQIFPFSSLSAASLHSIIIIFMENFSPVRMNLQVIEEKKKVMNLQNSTLSSDV